MSELNSKSELLYPHFYLLNCRLILIKNLLRQIFLTSFKEKYNKEWTDKKENDFFKIGAGKKFLNSSKKVKKILLESGNSNEWDITLLCAIFQSTLFSNNKSTTKLDLVLIERIRDVRNPLSHPSTLEISDKVFNERYNELALILIELGEIEITKLLRQMFLTSFKEKYNKEWTDKEENDFFKVGAGEKFRNSCEPIQQKCLESGNSNEWDKTLLCAILTSNLFSSTKSSTKLDTVLIQRISSVCNPISHTATLDISDKVFNERYNELALILIELGVSKECLENKITSQAGKTEPDTNAQILKESANEEFKKNNYEHAIEIYTSAIILPNLSYQELGVLYRNRSLSHLKLYEETNDENILYRALADAKNTCFYQPVWFKGYAQLGEIYQKMNKLLKAVTSYEKALAFSINNDEVKNNLVHLTFKLNEQSKKRMHKQFYNIHPNIIEISPLLKDVWTGHEYRDGSINVEQSYEKAAKYYSKAAQSNNAEGIYNLACLMMKGLGVKKDFNAALSLLNMAAKQKPTLKHMGSKIINVGVREAEHSLGLIYQEGIRVPKSLEIAYNWYRLSLEHGSPQSANNLGLMYFNGDGVDKNIKQAEILFILSYERGDINASANLVDLYIHELDPDRALKWHKISLKSSNFLSKMKDNVIRKQIEDIKKLKKYTKGN